MEANRAKSNVLSMLANMFVPAVSHVEYHHHNCTRSVVGSLLSTLSADSQTILLRVGREQREGAQVSILTHSTDEFGRALVDERERDAFFPQPVLPASRYISDPSHV